MVRNNLREFTYINIEMCVITKKLRRDGFCENVWGILRMSEAVGTHNPNGELVQKTTYVLLN